MALSLKNPKAEALVNEVVKETGENRTQAIISSLQERLVRLKGRKMTGSLIEELKEISKRCSTLPDLDKRSPEQILGYNKKGIFD